MLFCCCCRSCCRDLGPGRLPTERECGRCGRGLLVVGVRMTLGAARGATGMHNLAVSHFAAELKDEASAGIAKVENWFKKLF